MRDASVQFVNENLLLDDALIIEMQRHSAGVVSAGTSETTCLHFENVVAAIPVSVDPLADGVAKEGGYDLLRPRSPVREDATVVVDVICQNVGRLRRDDELHLTIPIGHPRHAWRPASIGHVGRALSSFGSDGLKDGYVLRRQWSRNGATPRLALVITSGAADRASLAAEIGILRIVPRLSIGNRDAQRCQKCDN